MARTRHESPYNQEGLYSLVEQIEELLDDVVIQAEEERKEQLLAELLNPEIEDSFAVWVLYTEDLNSALEKGKDLTDPDLTKDTEHWHHQIKFSNGRRAYARSVGSETKPTHVGKLSVSSSLAKNIDEAVVWLDSAVPNRPWVRLLTVPAYQVNALWWIEGGKSQVRVLPGRFIKLPEPNPLLNSQGFLQFLVKDVKKPVGIKPKRGLV